MNPNQSLQDLLLKINIIKEFCTNRGPKLCNNFAAEHMSATVTSCIPPSKADASFKLGVIMSAMGKRFSLHSETKRQQLLSFFPMVSYGNVQ